MATKKNSSMTMGGALVFLGALIYLYVAYGAYNAGTGPWLSAATFLGPFAAAFAIFSAVSLFFLGMQGMAGTWSDNTRKNIVWKFVMWGAITFLIWTAGGAYFTWVVVALVLTYLGAAWAGM